MKAKINFVLSVVFFRSSRFLARFDYGITSSLLFGRSRLLGCDEWIPSGNSIYEWTKYRHQHFQTLPSKYGSLSNLHPNQNSFPVWFLQLFENRLGKMMKVVTFGVISKLCFWRGWHFILFNPIWLNGSKVNENFEKFPSSSSTLQHFNPLFQLFNILSFAGYSCRKLSNVFIFCSFFSLIK